MGSGALTRSRNFPALVKSTVAEPLAPVDTVALAPVPVAPGTGELSPFDAYLRTVTVSGSPTLAVGGPSNSTPSGAGQASPVSGHGNKRISSPSCSSCSQGPCVASRWSYQKSQNAPLPNAWLSPSTVSTA